MPAPVEPAIPANLLTWLHELGWPKRYHTASGGGGDPVLVWLADQTSTTSGADRPAPLEDHAIEPLFAELLRVLRTPHATGYNGRTPLHAACESPRLTRLLLEAGAPVDAPDGYGSTALFHAVRVRSVEVVEVLLAAGANPSASGHFGNALHAAASAGCLPLLDRFLALGLDPNAPSNRKEQYTPLMSATFTQEDVIERLVAAGARVDDVSPRGDTALIRALYDRASPAMLDFLLDRRASVYAAFPEAPSPVCVAASHHPAALPRLLEAGADPNERYQDQDALTRLIKGWVDWGEGSEARRTQNLPAHVERLLEAGARPEAARQYLAHPGDRDTLAMENPEGFEQARALLSALELRRGLTAESAPSAMPRRARF